MAIQQNFPDLKPSLLLDFARTKKLDPRVTFTRASSGTYFDSTGVLRTAANNEARFTHDPVTGDSLGIMREPQRANGIRNNTMQGAVVGTPGTLPTNWAFTGGGLAANVISIGVEDGINYIDIQFVGTATSSSSGFRFEGNTGIAATPEQTWASTFYVRRVGGSTSGFSTIGTSLAALAGSTALNLRTIPLIDDLDASSLATFRSLVTLTTTNVTTTRIRPQILLTYSTGSSVDITLRIGLPQLELGEFPTSVIRTTTASVTRAADSITNNYLGRTGQGTYFVDSTTQSGDTLITSGGTTFASTAATQQRTAVAYDATDTRRSIDGGAVTSSAGTTGATSLTIADGASGQISKVALYPVKLTDAQLQALTS